MDPITVAARRFLRDVDRFWKRHPERIARLAASEGDRTHVRKTLRLAEYDPANRRPLFIHDGPFEAAETFFAALCERVTADYALLRRGAAEQGVALDLLDPPARSFASSPEAHAHAVICAAAERLVPRLDGAVVALMPGAIAAESEWRRSIERLSRMPRPASLRVAVLDSPDDSLAPILGEEAARFSLSMDELFDFFEQQQRRASQGPATPEPPALPPELRAALEQSGRKPPGPETAAALQSFFLKGARAASKNDFKAAAAEYRRARDLSRDEGLRLEEAGAAFALAGAFLAAGSIPMAQATYSQAALLAAEQKLWTMACQAKLGEAGAGWIDKDHGRAARAYSEAAALAERGEIVLLRIEALRMEGHCHLQRGAEPDTIRAWRKVVDAGAAADEPTRRTSSFTEVVTSLANLLEQRGLASQAAEVRASLDSAPRASDP